MTCAARLRTNCITLTLLAYPFVFAAASRGEGVAWQKDFPAALEAAKSRNVPLMVEFYTKTCPHSRQMEQTVHTDPAVVKLSAGQVWVRLDQLNDPDGRRLVRELNAGATPTYMAVAHDARTVYWRFSGPLSAAAFAHTIGLIDASSPAALAPAKAALMRGDVEQGKALFRQVVEAGAGDVTDDALVLLGCIENAAWTDEGAQAAQQHWTRVLSEHGTSDRAPDAALYLAALLPDVGERAKADQLRTLLAQYPAVDAAAAKQVLDGTAPAAQPPAHPRAEPPAHASPPVAEASAPAKPPSLFGVPIAKAPPSPTKPATQESAVALKPADPMPKADRPAKPKVAKPPKPKEAETRISAKQPHKPKGLAGVGLTPEQVNQAIDKGSAFLWNFIKQEDMAKNGYKLGDNREHVLACLALVHAGAHKRFPDLDAALRTYLTRIEPRGLGVYDTAILCMLIESYGDPSFYPKLRRAARCVVENQGDRGAWSYGRTIPAEFLEDEAQAKPLQATGGIPLEGPGAGEKPWTRLTPWSESTNGDNSVSQYALLGLHAASRCGIPVPQDTWQRSLDIHRKRQNKDGSWGYDVGPGYGSMNCAGICALAINRHELGEKEPWNDEGIERGLAWLAQRFTVIEHVQHTYEWHYYYLYSLERVGRLLETEFIGEHEWYPLGAKHLVDSQKPDGRWESKGDSDEPRLPGSFALLFLTRATPTLGEQLKRGGDGTLKTAVVVPSNRIHIILDCSGSMLGEMNGKQKFQIAKDAVASLLREMPDDAEVGLRVYGHRKRATEEGSSEDVELLIPIDKLDRDAFLKQLAALRARGKTPLAMSLREAMDELKRERKESVTVVLLTDGGEDTWPRQDPLKAAEEFATLRNVHLHVVGFDIGRADWTEQLLAMTARAGGRYYAAADDQALQRELRASVFGVPSDFTVLDAHNRPIAQRPFGESIPLREGRYTLRAHFGGQSFDEPFWINTQRVTVLSFDASKVQTPAPGTVPVPAPTATIAPDVAPATASKKFCTACGAPLTPNVKFCQQCGDKVGP